jgi:DNA-binding MarR family transcriptional regulator
MKKSNTIEFPPSRKALVTATHLAGRDLSAQSVMFYTMIAEHIGLGVSDLRAWDLLLQNGPITAGEFAALTGLTPGAVTGLINRLEQAGAVRRRVDRKDRRKVIIEVARSLRNGPNAAYFQSFKSGIQRVFTRYTDAELVRIREFLEDMTRLLHRETVRLRSKPHALRAKRRTPRKRAN